MFFESVCDITGKLVLGYEFLLYASILSLLSQRIRRKEGRGGDILGNRRMKLEGMRYHESPTTGCTIRFLFSRPCENLNIYPPTTPFSMLDSRPLGLSFYLFPDRGCLFFLHLCISSFGYCRLYVSDAPLVSCVSFLLLSFNSHHND